MSKKEITRERADKKLLYELSEQIDAVAALLKAINQKYYCEEFTDMIESESKRLMRMADKIGAAIFKKG